MGAPAGIAYWGFRIFPMDLPRPRVIYIDDVRLVY